MHEDAPSDRMFAALERLISLDVACDYWDVRLGQRTGWTLDTSLPGPPLCHLEAGAYLRVWHEGRWVCRGLEAPEELDRALRCLVETARALPPGDAPPPPSITPLRTEPVSTPSPSSPADGMALVQRALAVYEADPDVASAHALYAEARELHAFCNSRGALGQYSLRRSHLSTRFAIARVEGRFLDSFDAYGEVLDPTDVLIDLQADLDESRRFLAAEPVTPGIHDVVLDCEVAGVFAHECVGHKLEADFQTAASSGFTPGNRVAPSCFSVVDDGSLAGSAGSTPFDADGVLAGPTRLIDAGVVTSQLHDLRSAAVSNAHPTGNARAVDLGGGALIRMTNTFVVPGEDSQAELLARVGEGLFIRDYRQASGGGDFVINPVRAFAIRAGHLAEPVLVHTITGDVATALANIIGVSSVFRMENLLIGGCDKADQRGLAVAYGGGQVAIRGVGVV